ncbi:MAG: FecR domain-containing protein [Fibrobacterota bacterium]
MLRIFAFILILTFAVLADETAPIVPTPQTDSVDSSAGAVFRPESFTGSVSLLIKGDSAIDTTLLSAETVIMGNERIILLDSAALKLKSSGGSILDISGKSDIIIHEISQSGKDSSAVEKARISIKSGSVEAEIPTDNGKADYAFMTPSAAVNVTGTELGLLVSESGKTVLNVIKGSVLIKPKAPGAETRKVAAGEKVSVEKGSTDIADEKNQKEEKESGPKEGSAAEKSPSPAPAAPVPAPPAEAPETADSTPDTAETEEKEEPDDSKGKSAGMSTSMSVGSVTINGQQWTRLSLRPDIPIGNFGVAFDIELFIDQNSQISDKGWQFDNATEAVESILRKIYYVRYGHPGDKLYAKVGALDNVTLGYGLIMSGYSNAMQYPEVKMLGLDFELNDIGPLGFGTELMVNNFQDFQKGGALVGLRGKIKPLKTTGLPVLSNLETGVSFVTDMNQRATLRDRDGDKCPDLLDEFPDNKRWCIADTGVIKEKYSQPTKDEITAVAQREDSAYIEQTRGFIEGEDPISMFGADIGLPVLSKGILGLTVYGQYAMTIDDSTKNDSHGSEGFGITAPGILANIGPLNMSLEYRYFKDEFKAGYFDKAYELDRMKMYKDQSLLAKDYFLERYDGTTMSGVYAGASLNIVNLITARAGADFMSISYEDDTLAAPKKSRSIKAEAGVGETVKRIIEKFKIADVSAYYHKDNIGTYPMKTNSDGEEAYDTLLEPTPYTIMGYKVGFKVSEGVVLLYDNQYVYVLDEKSDGTGRKEFKSEKRMNLETVISF